MMPRRAEPSIRATVEIDRGIDLSALEARLGRAVDVAARRASVARAPRVATVTVEMAAHDPIALLHAAHSAGLGAALWARPDEGLALVGVGEAWSVTSDERSRIGGAGREWLALVRDAVCDVPADATRENQGGESLLVAGQWGTGPVAIGGFAFDHRAPLSEPWSSFGRGTLTVPRVAILTSPGGCAVTLTVVVVPGRDASRATRDAMTTLAPLIHKRATPSQAGEGPSPLEPLVLEELRPAAEWRSVVAEAASAVRRGVLSKVVVARGVRVKMPPGFPSEIDPARVLVRLRAEYPSCALFAISRSDRAGRRRWFVGATPERLVRVRGGMVSAMALAGSAPRGTDEPEDRRHGDALLASAKDRVEHSLVVDVMREALTATCEAVEIAEAPGLLRLSNVQHLHTPMMARLRPGTSALDLVDRLHPTPAVGGVPREGAIAWLREHEGLDRGWYAGPVGWIDRHGEGEFSVAIRSALLGPDESLLYTGCGIVGDSVPTFEYAESRLKLRPMLSALGSPSVTPRRDGGAS